MYSLERIREPDSYMGPHVQNLWEVGQGLSGTESANYTLARHSYMPCMWESPEIYQLSGPAHYYAEKERKREMKTENVLLIFKNVWLNV